MSKVTVMKVVSWASILLVVCIIFIRHKSMFGTIQTNFGDICLSMSSYPKTPIQQLDLLSLTNTQAQPKTKAPLADKEKATADDNNANNLADETKNISLNVTRGIVGINLSTVTHIAFLKVHKAGSTTIQNMLFRFGIKKELNIILSKKGNQLWSKAEELPIRKGQHYDIFALHTIYNKKFFDSLLPANHVKIGIIREPLSRMISAAYYHRDVFHVAYLRRVPRANYIHNLVNFPEKYDRLLFSKTRNTMARDFGFSGHWNQTEIKTYLEELNSQFLFVLLMEKFDESLVYLRRLLNWSVSDILYIKTNLHKHPPVVLNGKEQEKFRITNVYDFYVYNHFSKVFDKKLKQAPSDFWQEVTYFKKLVHEVSFLCGHSKLTQSAAPVLSVQETKFNGHFEVTSADCAMMKTPELSFIEKLRRRHRRRQNLTS